MFCALNLSLYAGIILYQFFFFNLNGVYMLCIHIKNCYIIILKVHLIVIIFFYSVRNERTILSINSINLSTFYISKDILP